MNITLEEQLEELQRELKMREKVFPNWVKQGRMREPVAKSRILKLKAAIESIELLITLQPDLKSQQTLFDGTDQ